MADIRLADIDVDILIDALKNERLAWINDAREQNERLTDAQRVVVNMLQAIENTLRSVVTTYELRKYNPNLPLEDT